MKVGMSSSDQRLSAHTTHATNRWGPHLSSRCKPFPRLSLSCMCVVKLFESVPEDMPERMPEDMPDRYARRYARRYVRIYDRRYVR